MKKFICIIISVFIIFTLAACGKKADEENTTVTTATTAAPAETTAPSTTPAPSTTTTAPATTTTASTTTTAAPSTTAPATTSATTTTAEITTTAPTTTAPTTKAAEKKSDSQKVSLAAVKEKVLKAADVTGQMDITTDRLTELYGISKSDVAQSAGFVTVSGAFPEEAVMIQAKDAAAKARIVDSLQTRLDDVKNQSASYDADSHALVQKCRVITSGNYVALFIANGHDKMESTFESAIN